MAEIVVVARLHPVTGFDEPGMLEVATCGCGHRFVMPGEMDMLMDHENTIHNGVASRTDIGWFVLPFISVNRLVLRASLGT